MILSSPARLKTHTSSTSDRVESKKGKDALASSERSYDKQAFFPQPVRIEFGDSDFEIELRLVEVLVV